MTELNVTERPVFIVGPLRSGTTLLRLMLENHPKTNFFGEFEGAVSQAKGNAFPDINEYHQFIASDRMMQDSNFTVDEKLNYTELVKYFLQQKHIEKPSDVIGGCIHSRFDLITKIWPDAKFIHITRDPRDVAKSSIPMGWAGNVYGGSEFWLGPELRWAKLKQDLPTKSYIEVQYEQLIRATATELTKVCDFIGVDYDDNMPNIDQISSYSKPDPKLVEQWRKKQSAKEVVAVESQCRELMLSLGYQVVNPNTDNDPSSLQRTLLKLDNKMKKVSFSIKRYGLSLWVYKFLSNKLPAFKNEKMNNKVNTIERLYLK